MCDIKCGIQSVTVYDLFQFVEENNKKSIHVHLVQCMEQKMLNFHHSTRINLLSFMAFSEPRE